MVSAWYIPARKWSLTSPKGVFPCEFENTLGALDFHKEKSVRLNAASAEKLASAEMRHDLEMKWGAD